LTEGAEKLLKELNDSKVPVFITSKILNLSPEDEDECSDELVYNSILHQLKPSTRWTSKETEKYTIASTQRERWELQKKKMETYLDSEILNILNQQEEER